MAELQHLTPDDLKELSKVIEIEKSDTACYEIDGKVRSMYQRNEHGYRIKVKGADDIYMFMFNDNKKPVAVAKFNETLDEHNSFTWKQYKKEAK